MAHTFFIIKSGEAVVSKGGQTINTLYRYGVSNLSTAVPAAARGRLEDAVLCRSVPVVLLGPPWSLQSRNHG